MPENNISMIVRGAAEKHHVDPHTLLALGQIESGLNPSAQNPGSSAGGLFQFVDGTWARYGNGASKFDPSASADAGARLMRDNMLYLNRKLGRAPTPGELYLAHQQGAAGAVRMISNPTANAAQVLGLKAVSGNLPAEMRDQAQTITLGDLAKVWTSKMDKAMGGVQPYTATALSPSLNPNASPGFTVYDAMDPTKTNVPITAVTPTIPISDQRRLAAERKAAEEGPGFFEAVGDAAYSQNWGFIRDLNDIFDGKEILSAVDPDWKPDAEYLKSRFEEAEIPQQYWEGFDDAHSEAHFNALIDRTKHIMEVDRELGKLGAVENLAIRMGVAIADPIGIAATVAVGALTGGVGGGAMIASRVGRVALAAGEGMAANVAADWYQQADNVTYGSRDMLLSAASGMIMGGAFGAFRGDPELAQQVTNIGRSMEAEVSRGVGDLSAAGAPGIRPGLEGDMAATRAMANQLAKDLGIEPVANNLRFDLSSSLQSVKSGIYKVVGRSIVGDPVGPKRGQVAEIGVDEIQERLFRHIENDWTSSVIPQWTAYRKRNGLKGAAAEEGEKRFREGITDFVWAATDAERRAFDPEIQKAGQAFQRIMADWTDLMNNPGKLTGKTSRPVRGAGELAPNDRYVPRIHDLEKIRELTSKYGFSKIDEPVYDDAGRMINAASMERGGLTTLVSKSMRDASPDLPVNLANKFAYGYLRKVYSLMEGQEVPLHRILAGEDMGELKRLLTELLDDASDKRLFSDEEINEFVSHFQKANLDAGAPSRLKHRTLLNENASVKLSRIDTNVMDEVSMKDLFVRDSHHLMTVYSRSMSGRVALAQWQIPDGKGGLLIDGIDSDAAFDTLLRKMRKIGVEDGLTKGELDKADRQLRFAYNAIVGYPNHNNASTFATSLRMLNDYNFLRVMGQVGFAQIPELANVAAHTGVRTFMRSMPALRDFVRNAKTGKLDTKLAQEVEYTIGTGTDWLRGTWYTRADEGVPLPEMSSGSRMNSLLQGMDKRMWKAKRFINAASGMAPVNTLLHRWTGQAIFYQFDKMARRFGGDISKMHPRDLNRLKALGLSESMTKRVFEQIRANRTGKGARLEALNIRQWGDVEAAAAFESAVFRHARTLVMENDLGNMPMWMAHPLSKSIFQFRSFMLGAHSKVLLKGLNQRDLYTFTSFASSVFLGSMTYIAQTYLNTVGREDQDEVLAKRFTPDQIALGGIMRSSWYTTLSLPTDIAHYAFMGTPVTSARTTGLATGFFGSPTIDLGNNVVNAIGSVGEMTHGNAFSRPDAQAWRSILPGQNLMGVTQVFNLLASGLPKYEDKN